jgi:hypothetical protein
MTENQIISDRPLQVALYDREFGEVDFRLFNAHTGRVEPPNSWIRFNPAPFNAEVGVFTDRNLPAVNESPHRINIAWLLESPELMRKHRRDIRRCEKFFDRVLTFEKSLLARSEKYIFCPLGGSWVAENDWAIYPKGKQLSIVCSRQNYLSGHKLRFDVVNRFKSQIDGLFGSAFQKIEKKLEGLRDYRFSIAIENCRSDYYFTEKLIDCFATGTVPIYWGCPSVGCFFNTEGILAFESFRELKKIMSRLSSDLYEDMMPAIEDNYRRAINYRVVEKNIFTLLYCDHNLFSA